MKLSQAAAALLFVVWPTASARRLQNSTCTLEPIPTNPDDFGEPAWETILELAFPPWAVPAGGCPRIDAVGGILMPEYR